MQVDRIKLGKDGVRDRDREKERRCKVGKIKIEIHKMGGKSIC